jgi:amino acid adenylation domain-containing protein
MRNEVIEGFQLSPQQRRLWPLQAASAAFCAQAVTRLAGALDADALGAALRRVAARHEIFRTTFADLPGMKLPVQVVGEMTAPALREVVVGDGDRAEQERRIDELCADERRAGFDLRQSPPARFVLLTLAPREHILVATLPALCADRRTLSNFSDELRRAYESCVEGADAGANDDADATAHAGANDDANDDDDAVQYARFSEWQNELLESGGEGAGEEFWSALNVPGLSAPALPLEGREAAAGAFEMNSVTLTGEPQLRARAEAVAARYGARLESVLLACWQTLLWRLSAQAEIPVHIECDGRAYEEMASGLGLYARWPPVNAKFVAGLRFADVLARADGAARDAREWQEYFSWEHFAARHDESSGGESTAGAVGFSCDEWPGEASAGGISFRTLKLYACTERFKLWLACSISADALQLDFNYDTAVFDGEGVGRIARQFVSLLRSATAEPESAAGGLPILDVAERRRILYDWNATATDYPQDACWHELFEAQVARTPQALALVAGHESLTYDELNRRANMLAHYLRELGVGAETRVALCAERSAEMIVGLLGVLKAGGAYVPLDPAQPKARLGYMLEDADAHVLLTHKSLSDALPACSARIVRLDADWSEIARASDLNPTPNVRPDNLAYVIYTSGSTGRPKGVGVTHNSVVNLGTALWQRVYEEQISPLRVSLNAPLAFDSSVKQIVQLCFGHALYVLPEEVRRDASAMRSFQERHELDVLDCTPSQLRLWLEAGLGGDWKHAPTRLLIGGEALDESLWRELSRQTGIASYNVYGPTECTVDATACRVSAKRARPALGRPLANVRVYVLDENLQPAPIGVAGELHIGGAGVGRGYLNHPGLTAEKFIPDSFGDAAGARLYRTGDLARLLPDGNVEFLGRMDFQVKIRGSRIELREIESELAAHPAVREAVVLAREDNPGDKRLVAYVLTRKGADASTSDLHGFLRERLPDYMIPSAFVALDALPLTPNGKVDRKALAAPDHLRPQLRAAFVAPRTPTEELLAGIWAEVIGLSRVGVNDSFFELGGHSLLATQITARVRRAFEIDLPLRYVFEAPTIGELAACVEAIAAAEGSSATAPVVRVPRGQSLPLSFAQQRLWFLDQLEPGGTAYNIPYAVRLQGALDTAALTRALSEIVRRHEALRTTFALSDAQPVQIITPARPLDLPLTDLRELVAPEREAEAMRALREEAGLPFDLARGPLVRARLLRTGELEHLLALTLHHIVFDASSIPVLMREMTILYEAYAAGEESPLAELPVQYADFAHWQRAALQGETLERHLGYWRTQLEGAPMLDLPTDRPRPPYQTYDGARISFRLEDSLAHALGELNRREGVTMFMTLLAAFKTLLYRYTAQEDIVVGTPVAGRAQSETEGLIGFFLNTLVMRTRLDGDLSFRELLGRVREAAVGAYAHQDLPFEKLVEELEPERNLSRAPFFQVMFSARNVATAPVSVTGLTISGLEVETGTAKFDLLLFVDESDGGVSVAFEYNTDLFDAATVGRMGSHFSALLARIVADPAERLSRLRMLGAHEREQLLYGWNETRRANAPAPTVARLFEDQAERTPHAVALVSGEEELTYAELNGRANRLARRLQELGVRPEVFVGILMHRSTEMMVGVLGILKAGGAYVALDPSYPRERIAFMLADTAAPVLLTQRHLAANIPDERALTALCMDEEPDSACAAQASGDLPPASAAANLAYVTYTSGSTGAPKGIAMPQRAVLNLLAWQLRTTHLPPGARTLQFASLSFDVSFQDMFSTWGVGGTLVLVTEEERREIAGLARVLTEKKIQRLFIPAVALQQLAEGFCAAGDFSAPLRKIIAGSEQLQITRPVARLFAELKECSLHNEYGPSEAHVVTELALLPVGDPAAWPERPSIGYPIDNSQIYILDRHMEPVPVGTPGELMIGGEGVARGYLNRPGLTAEKFIPDPFGDAAGARLYRTGDLARWLHDGQIEFLGRMDFQVKIRGFRVEPGEVEAALSRHPSVLEAIVVARDESPGTKRLVAYVVVQQEPQPSVSELRAFTQETLPEYMVPSAFVFLDKLPLTPNGKVDRKKLPAPDQTRPELEHAYVAPRTALEEAVASIWSKVLDIEQVGVHDNFFELGGHSLLATQVATRVREAFGVEVPLRFLFESPTVAGLTGKMSQADASSAETLESIALVLSELAELSDEEAEAMLSQERASAGAQLN